MRCRACFTIIVRLAIVDGPSMRHTLENSDALLVSNLFFERNMAI